MNHLSISSNYIFKATEEGGKEEEREREREREKEREKEETAREKEHGLLDRFRWICK
jgi:hypothetical protein